MEDKVDGVDYFAIGQRIRRFRRARGLSQEQLAELVGISVPHMSHIETANTKLSLPVFIRIAAALGVCADALLREESPETGGAQVQDILRLLSGSDARELNTIRDIVRASVQALELNYSPENAH